MNLAFALLAAYLVGSIPTSFLAGKLAAGIDLREHGSKNLGATNVFRVLGWKYAVPVLLLDAGKGLVAAVVLARWVGPEPWAPFLLGTAAVVGHVYTVFLRFKGGKGVATAAGVMIGVAPVAIGISVGIWIVVVLASGLVSLASVLASLAFPAVCRMVNPGDLYSFGAGVVLALLIVYTHRSNIRRLLSGTEARIGNRGKKPA